jgi:CRP-like cAMP-binding protein
MLLESRTVSERKQVLQLVLKVGDAAIPSVIDRIKQGEAWYYLRNLALLVGKLGNEAHVNALQPLLGHEDVRVKREALNAIFKIGGAYRSEILLSALPRFNDSMKAQVVELLGKIEYQEADKPLLALLASRPFFHSRAREELEEKICVALAHIGSQRAIPVLGSIVEIEPSSGVEPYSARVKTAASNALAMIRRKQVQEGGKGDSDRARDTHVLESKVIEREELTESNLLRQEKLADQLVRDGNKQAAVRVLFNLVVEYAKGKNFKKAEAFRDKLFEVDSMALSEIVQANEIIDEEKRESIDQYHLKIWSDLYDTLSTEEANALYYAMENRKYDPDHAVFEQGNENRHLYFIDRGQLKTVYRQGGREILLKTLGRGDIAGSETFFSNTICTTSVITLSHTKLKLLDSGVVEKLKDEFPSLVSKLRFYCLKFEKVHDLLKKRDLDRRSQKRIEVQGKGMIQLLNAEKIPIGRPFGADFADISAGGLCFVIKLPNRKSARLLLGRHLHAKFTLATRQPKIKIDQSGTVSAVHSLPFDEYSIHVKLDRPLSQRVMREAMRFSHTGREGRPGP